MFIYYHYFKSKNKRLYSELAEKHATNIFHVYRLARGGSVRTNSDYEIVQDLINAQIVSGIV